MSLAWNRPPLKPVVYRHGALRYWIVLCWDWRDLCRCVPIVFWLLAVLDEWRSRRCANAGLANDCKSIEGLVLDWHWIGNEWAIDCQSIGNGFVLNWIANELSTARLRGLAFQWFGTRLGWVDDGLTSDRWWHWIGIGLTSDWHRIGLNGAGVVRSVLHWSRPRRCLWHQIVLCRDTSVDPPIVH